MGIIKRIMEAIYEWIVKDGFLSALQRILSIIKIGIITPYVKLKEYTSKKAKYFLDFETRRNYKKKRNVILKKMYWEIRSRDFKRREVKTNNFRSSVVIRTSTSFIMRLRWNNGWKMEYKHTYQPKFNPLPSNQIAYLLDLLDGKIVFLFRKNRKTQLLDKEFVIPNDVRKVLYKKIRYRKSAVLSLKKEYYDNLC